MNISPSSSYFSSILFFRNKRRISAPSFSISPNTVQCCSRNKDADLQRVIWQRMPDNFQFMSPFASDNELWRKEGWGAENENVSVYFPFSFAAISRSVHNSKEIWIRRVKKSSTYSSIYFICVRYNENVVYLHILPFITCIYTAAHSFSTQKWKKIISVLRW
jgi:hypothetical protein